MKVDENKVEWFFRKFSSLSKRFPNSFIQNLGGNSVTSLRHLYFGWRIRQLKKVDLGGGIQTWKDWVSLDLIYGINLIETSLDFIPNNSVDCFSSHHFFEHISFEDAISIIDIAKNKLISGGRLRIAVPDKYDKLNERSLMSYGHISAWSFSDCEKISKSLGLKLQLIHWFDESGQFHSSASELSELGILDLKEQLLMTPYGNFRIINGLGRVNKYGGTLTPESSLFFDLIKMPSK